MHAVFDGHNDVLHRLLTHAATGGDPVRQFAEGTDEGHLDAPRAKAGGLAGGLCAIYIASDDMTGRVLDANGHYAIPMPKPLDRREALDIALEMAAIALRLDRAGAWKLCCSTAEIRAAMAAGVFAAVLHMEGAEAIGADLSALDVFYAAGLRSLGPVWSRHTIFGHGVPFAYPANPDTGPGLTAAGFDLVRACNRLGILVDLAHITEQGFWDVAKTSTKPLVHSHSNVHALTRVARNLTDRQMDAICDSGGIAGLNFATTMLRADGLERTDTPLSDLVRHIDYMVDRMGIDCVGLGSDFDGATIPQAIGNAAGTQALVCALKTVGYTDENLKKLCCDNWLRVLGAAWHEPVE